MHKYLFTKDEITTVDPKHDGEASIDIQSWGVDIQVEAIF